MNDYAEIVNGNIPDSEKIAMLVMLLQMKNRQIDEIECKRRDARSDAAWDEAARWGQQGGC